MIHSIKIIFLGEFVKDEEIEQLKLLYKKRKGKIKSKLEEFRNVLNQPDEKIFAELCFCLCTPQSKAETCDRVIGRMEKNGMLLNGSEKEIKPFLNVVRFGNTKAKRIVKSRSFFTTNGKINIRERLRVFKDTKKLRDWLVENIDGFGMKEASHFIRNIGLGENVAILDRHILCNLKKFGIIGETKSLTKKKYLEIENKMKEFADFVGIPLEELDLLFWSKETGKIVK